jgi:enamine deaminase RidA (YjgF/YER057c/UK114 family)
MQRRSINPWTWQDPYGFVQANEVIGAQRVLYVSGQTSNDAQGNVTHPGDMAAQVNACFDNLESVLKQANMTLANVVRLTYYTTQPDMLLANWKVVVDRLNAGGCKPASTFLGVARLAFPDWMLEIEATAVA